MRTKVRYADIFWAVDIESFQVTSEDEATALDRSNGWPFLAAELGVIVGKADHKIWREDAMSYTFGSVCQYRILLSTRELTITLPQLLMTSLICKPDIHCGLREDFRSKFRIPFSSSFLLLFTEAFFSHHQHSISEHCQRRDTRDLIKRD